MKQAPSKWDLGGVWSLILIVGGAGMVIAGMFFAATAETLVRVASYLVSCALGALLYHRWLGHSAAFQERRRAKFTGILTPGLQSARHRKDSQ